MKSFEATVEIDVPVRTAYNQWTQFRSFPRFMTVVRSVEQVRPTITRWVVGLGPLRREFEAEIVEQQPDSHVVWQCRERSSFHLGAVSFRSAASGTTVVAVRITALTSVPGLWRRVLRRELGHFKEFIEGLGEEGGAWRGTVRDGRVLADEPHPPRCHVPTWPVG